MNEEEWYRALEKFLAPWLGKAEVIGALVTGSYVLGTNTPQSDIDVHIFLTNETNWKERGNEIVDGYLIEYFANPIGLYNNIFNMDYADNQRTNARMISLGEVIADKTGAVAEIKNSSIKFMARPFRQLTGEQIEDRKYWLWDSMDGLDDLLSSNAPSSELVYFSHLGLLLSVYTVYLGAEMPHLSKVYKLFKNDDFRKRYHFTAFPDEAFAEEFLGALTTQRNQQLDAARKLTKYVLDAMGGFSIDGWRLRSPGDSIEV